MKKVRAFCGMVLSLLRELADENAYRRHLNMCGLTHSPEVWRAFSDERAKMRYSRPKCC